MDIAEAIQTAIKYETRIHDLYQKASVTISDPVGQKILKALGTDELHHLAYLTGRLEMWRKTGDLIIEDLESTLPPLDRLDGHAGIPDGDFSRMDKGDEKQILSRALSIEIETSNFYRRMTKAMSGEARRMFSRFLNLEDEHIEIVQAELDYLSKSGYWFGFKEFDME